MLNRDWDEVLSEQDRGIVEIDEEPQMDELRFVKITSIVPNWVEFGFRALQLAKVWWTTANRIYGPALSTDDETRDNKEGCRVQPPYFDDIEGNEVVSLEEEVATLSDCACQISVEIDSLRDELKQVRKHGERVETLYKKIGDGQHSLDMISCSYLYSKTEKITRH